MSSQPTSITITNGTFKRRASQEKCFESPYLQALITSKKTNKQKEGIYYNKVQEVRREEDSVR